VLQATNAPVTLLANVILIANSDLCCVTGYKCPSNVVSYAVRYDGATRVVGTSCYEIVPYRDTWNNAEYHCQQKGGHLVHIANLAEENAVMKFLYDNQFDYAVWIGLTDKGHEEKFTWSSGKTLNVLWSRLYFNIYQMCHSFQQRVVFPFHFPFHFDKKQQQCEESFSVPAVYP